MKRKGDDTHTQSDSKRYRITLASSLQELPGNIIRNHLLQFLHKHDLLVLGWRVCHSLRKTFTTIFTDVARFLVRPLYHPLVPLVTEERLDTTLPPCPTKSSEGEWTEWYETKTRVTENKQTLEKQHEDEELQTQAQDSIAQETRSVCWWPVNVTATRSCLMEELITPIDLQGLDRHPSGFTLCDYQWSWLKNRPTLVVPCTDEREVIESLLATGKHQLTHRFRRGVLSSVTVTEKPTPFVVEEPDSPEWSWQPTASICSTRYWNLSPQWRLKEEKRKSVPRLGAKVTEKLEERVETTLFVELDPVELIKRILPSIRSCLPPPTVLLGVE